jgi:DNA-binding HxlR family transcriptional regulator
LERRHLLGRPHDRPQRQDHHAVGQADRARRAGRRAQRHRAVDERHTGPSYELIDRPGGLEAEVLGVAGRATRSASGSPGSLIVGKITPIAGRTMWFFLRGSAPGCSRRHLPAPLCPVDEGTSWHQGTEGTLELSTRVQQTHACEIRDLLDRLGDKWSLLVVELLGEGTDRFTELRHAIDHISQRTLTLRRRERAGLVRRTVHPVVPAQVDYDLTPLAARCSSGRTARHLGAGPPRRGRRGPARARYESLSAGQALVWPRGTGVDNSSSSATVSGWSVSSGSTPRSGSAMAAHSSRKTRCTPGKLPDAWAVRIRTR